MRKPYALAALVVLLLLAMPAGATISNLTGDGFTYSNGTCGTNYSVKNEDTGVVVERPQTLACADVHAPSATMTAPTGNPTVSGSMTASATATDPTPTPPPVERVSGVASVQFLVDGSNYGAPDTTAPYSVALDTTGLSNGPHNVSAVATDGAANVGAPSAAAPFQVSNVAPPTANLWVDTNGGSCTRFASPALYNDAAACASATAATTAASCGDRIYFAAGTYPQQSSGKACASATLTIAGTPSGGAVLDVPAATDGSQAKAFLVLSGADRLQVGPDFEMLDGFSVELSSTTDHITLLGNNIHSTAAPSATGTWAQYTSYGVVNRMTKPGSTLSIIGNTIKDVAVQCTGNGDTSGCDKNDNSFGGGISRGYCINDFASQNLIVRANHIDGCWDDGIQVHAVNFTFTDNDVQNVLNPFVVGNHQDGIQIFSANPVNADVERNNFHGNLDTCMRFQNADHTGYIVRDNVCAGNMNTGFDFEHLHNSTVSFNTIGVEQYQSHIQADAADTGATDPSNDVFENNIVMPNRTGGCAWRLDGTGHTYRSNDLVACGVSGQLSASPTFLNAVMGADMRLAAGSVGIDAGIAEAGVTVDVGGRPRVVGAAPDIGARERQSTDP